MATLAGGVAVVVGTLIAIALVPSFLKYVPARFATQPVVTQ